ncbi:MAG: nucleoside hydrolase [Clostridia bacterium]|nr:nucleoside hydrolase [Clostridia bacterium]
MRSFILGTDWGEDCDDVVALRLISRFHKAGKAKLLGVCVNTCNVNTASSVYGLLNTEGMENIAVGVDKSVAHLALDARYQARLAKYAPDKTNDDAEDAVRLYRRLLAESEGKVEIMEIGFLHTLARALQSEGDDISPKTGMELFEEKVEKLWIMGGRYSHQGATEFNFSRYPEACVGANIICKSAPCPITFLGWEIGSQVVTCENITEGDCLYDVLCDWNNGVPTGRESWDPMLCLMAIIGDEQEAGYSAYNATVSVDASTGANYFEIDPSSNRKIVTKSHPDSYYIEMINAIIK